MVVVVSFVEKKEETTRCVRFNDIIKKEKKKEKRLVNLNSCAISRLLYLPCLFSLCSGKILWALPGNQIRQCLVYFICCVIIWAGLFFFVLLLNSDMTWVESIVQSMISMVAQ